jgi:SAM-dependent methyltransferase
MSMRVDAEAFRDFEIAGWDARAAAYVDTWATVTRYAVRPLLDAVRTGPGVRLLDVGCGPGELAATAVARGATAVAVDIAERMVARARGVHPELDVRVADAECLPFPDGAFDAVVANFLIPHLAEPTASLRELARVLKRGGRLAVTTWGEPARSPLHGTVLDAIRDAGVEPPPDLPVGPPPFLYSDPARLAELIGCAGLDDVAVRQLAFSRRLPGGVDELWRLHMEGTVRVPPIVLRQAPAVQASVRAALGERSRQYADGGAVTIPWLVQLAAGTRAARDTGMG